VGPANPRIFLAHPRIKVKHLLKTRYICNNLKKKSNTKALKWNDKNSRKIRSLFSDISIFLHRLNLFYVDLKLTQVAKNHLSFATAFFQYL
jgi:hypothetical protein